MIKMIKMIKDTFVRHGNTLRQWSNRLTCINKQIKQTPHIANNDNKAISQGGMNYVIIKSTIVNNKLILSNMKNQNEQITIKEKKTK